MTFTIPVNGTHSNDSNGNKSHPIIDVDMHSDYIQIINGKSAPTAESRHGLNPATLEPKAKVPVATKDDLDNAVKAAKTAFKTWSKVPYEDRRKAVLAYADAIESLRTEFRDLLISEQGKPVSYGNFSCWCCRTWMSILIKVLPFLPPLGPPSRCRNRCSNRLDTGHG